MRKLILTLILVFTIVGHGQNSAYNANRKMDGSIVAGKWYKKGKTECVVRHQSAAQYMITYRELLDILGLYRINFKNAVVDKSFKPDNVKYHDYNYMSMFLRNENAYIEKSWVCSKVIVTWYGRKEGNGITITKL